MSAKKFNFTQMFGVLKLFDVGNLADGNHVTRKLLTYLVCLILNMIHVSFVIFI